jgi:hypothetical protein
MNIFDGLYGYEKPMLLCGLILFAFALPAASHAALARACVVPGPPPKAQAHVDAVFGFDPHVSINAAVLHGARAGSRPMEL